MNEPHSDIPVYKKYSLLFTIAGFRLCEGYGVRGDEKIQSCYRRHQGRAGSHRLWKDPRRNEFLTANGLLDTTKVEMNDGEVGDFTHVTVLSASDNFGHIVSMVEERSNGNWGVYIN